MSSGNMRIAQIENTSHQSTIPSTRVSEIAIQADRDQDDPDELPKEKELEFDEPFLFSDAVLIVQGRKLHCHRAILSLYSPVFTAMFRNKCLENQKNEVIIPGDQYEDVKEVLLHMYTPGGRELSADAAQRLLPIFHRYQIDTMVSAAERAMAFRLTDSTAPACLQVADLYGLSRLRQAALESCARLDAERLAKIFQEVTLSAELKTEILEKRVSVLERCLCDIQNSFTHSFTRVESRMERVSANHCSEHNRPMATIKLLPTVNTSVSTRPTEGAISEVSALGDAAANRQTNSDVAASILPANAAMGNVDMRPIGEAGQRLSSSQTNLSNIPGLPANATSVVCEKCAEQLKNHVIELCKRGLHKIPIVMLKD